MSRPSNREERRGQIMDALVRLLPETGFGGASVSRIADEAGLTPGLVHYHFENKQEILLHVVQWLRSQLLARYRRFATQADGALGALHAFIDAHLALGDDADPAAVAAWVAISAEAQRQPAVSALYRTLVEEQFEILQTLVREASVEAKRATGSVRAHATALFAAIHGMYPLSTAASVVLPGTAAKTVRNLATELVGGARVKREAATS